MSESATRPEMDHSKEPGEAPAATQVMSETDRNHVNGEDSAHSDENTIERRAAETPVSSTPTTIWTPAFMLIFALVLVLGLSGESLLTQSWLNRYFQGLWVLAAHALLIGLCWLATAIFARSVWVRAGAIFGCLSATFAIIDFFISAHIVNPPDLVTLAAVQAHTNTALCLALAGSFICFSLDCSSSRSWEAWLYILAPIFGCGAVVVLYFLTPARDRSLITLEHAIAIVSLVLCLLTWWLRPSCWTTRPGLTFLYGLASIILLALILANAPASQHTSFPAQLVGLPVGYLTFNDNNFFCTLVALLCLLLGAIRILQGEFRRQKW